MNLPPQISAWFEARGWQPRRYQLEMLEVARAGRHALLVAPTGAGKTLAGFLPSLVDLIENPIEGLHTLYVSPLKALAIDVQRNLMDPIAEMGLDIKVESRTGDTPSDRKARQRVKPPHMLMTTPESLSLLLSHKDSGFLFENLKAIVVDEVHAFATGKRGDLLSLCMARLQRLAPAMRRVALSATVADPDAYRAWLAPGGDIDAVAKIDGDPGAEPDLHILLPEDRVPWSGHSGRYAAAQVMAEIETHRTTIIFCNTRSLAELIFQDLWAVNDQSLPIGIHHGSLSIEARRKVEAAMAAGRLRALVAANRIDEADAAVATLPEALAKLPEIERAKSALALAKEAKPVDDLAGLAAEVAANPDNLDKRFELAGGQMAAGDRDAAADSLLAIIAADRDWNEGAARQQLLKLFDVVGLEDPWVSAQRRRLSAILFG